MHTFDSFIAKHSIILYLPESWSYVNGGGVQPETMTYNISIVGVPVVIANGAPATVVQNLRTTIKVGVNVTGGLRRTLPSGRS